VIDMRAVDFLGMVKQLIGVFCRVDFAMAGGPGTAVDRFMKSF